MKWRTILGFITGSATVAGCGSLANLVLPNPETPAPPIACVVQYHRLHPQAFLGEDGCGNRWLMVPGDSMGTLKCLYWNEADGVLMEILCPEPGDTLGAK